MAAKLFIVKTENKLDMFTAPSVEALIRRAMSSPDPIALHIDYTRGKRFTVLERTVENLKHILKYLRDGRAFPQAVGNWKDVTREAIYQLEQNYKRQTKGRPAIQRYIEQGKKPKIEREREQELERRIDRGERYYPEYEVERRVPRVGGYRHERPYYPLERGRYGPEYVGPSHLIPPSGQYAGQYGRGYREEALRRLPLRRRSESEDSISESEEEVRRPVKKKHPKVRFESPVSPPKEPTPPKRRVAPVPKRWSPVPKKRIPPIRAPIVRLQEAKIHEPVMKSMRHAVIENVPAPQPKQIAVEKRVPEYAVVKKPVAPPKKAPVIQHEQPVIEPTMRLPAKQAVIENVPEDHPKKIVLEPRKKVSPRKAVLKRVPPAIPLPPRPVKRSPKKPPTPPKRGIPKKPPSPPKRRENPYNFIPPVKVPSPKRNELPPAPPSGGRKEQPLPPPKRISPKRAVVSEYEEIPKPKEGPKGPAPKQQGRKTLIRKARNPKFLIL